MLVRFLPAGLGVVAATGESLLETAVRAGLPLGSACGGEGVCRSCVVEVVDGAGLLRDRSDAELRWRLQPTQRLACQARFADLCAPRAHDGEDACAGRDEDDADESARDDADDATRVDEHDSAGADEAPEPDEAPDADVAVWCPTWGLRPRLGRR